MGNWLWTIYIDTVISIFFVWENWKRVFCAASTWRIYCIIEFKDVALESKKKNMVCSTSLSSSFSTLIKADEQR